jgi:hypothetical protein
VVLGVVRETVDVEEASQWEEEVNSFILAHGWRLLTGREA